MWTTVICTYGDDAASLYRTVKSAVDSGADEIVLVDDGNESKIPVNEVAEKLPQIKSVTLSENSGQAIARNVGIAFAQNDLVAILDVGDVFYPDKKAEQIKFTLENDYTCTFSRCVDELTGEVRPLNPNWKKQFLWDNPLQQSTVAFFKSRTKIPGEGGYWYRPFMAFGDDTEFHARIHRIHGFELFDQVTGTATCWPGGVSDSKQISPEKKQEAAMCAEVRNSLLGHYAQDRLLSTHENAFPNPLRYKVNDLMNYSQARRRAASEAKHNELAQMAENETKNQSHDKIIEW